MPWSNRGGVFLVVSRDKGKENGNHYLGFRGLTKGIYINMHEKIHVERFLFHTYVYIYIYSYTCT